MAKTEYHEMTIDVMERFSGPEAVRSSWNEPEEESLSCLDAIINQVDDLEEEDIICLEDFVFRDGNIGLGPASPENECGANTVQTNCDQETSDEGDKSTLSTDTLQPESVVKQDRKCRNQSRDIFVSYEVLPSAKMKGYMCEICGDHFSRKDSRKRHIISRHIQEKAYVCNICNKAFVFQFALTAHQAIHSPSAKYLCICGLAYTIRSSFLSHIRRIHVSEDDKVFVCELCLKSFSNCQALKCHVVAVHRAKTIKCLHKGCDKIFSTNGLMRSHYRYHMNMKFDCGVCGQSFSTKGYMKRHKLTHLGIRPHLCSKCGRSYVSASHLSRHQKVHSDERPFQCSFCGKQYKSKEHVAFHENIHRGEKPFKCAVCGYATAYKGTYYAHRKKHIVKSSDCKETV
ncbi:uncharacterized protein LOC143029584 isoform X2 [Oratosquilla oratoria]|uniref:uncharacterized protein LOC143029584 isoform X2 n=1 Tax=Oratosquilla oratoria TaxID=337810 RepID=UPI003F759193